MSSAAPGLVDGALWASMNFCLRFSSSDFTVSLAKGAGAAVPGAIPGAIPGAVPGAVVIPSITGVLLVALVVGLYDSAV